jgi:hypothetical protein
MLGYNNTRTQQSSGLTMLKINNDRAQKFSNWTRHSEQRKIKQLHDFKYFTSVKALRLGNSVRLMIMLQSGWMTTGGWFYSQKGKKYPLLQTSHPALGPTQHITGALSPRAKGPKCEADYSLQPSSEVKTNWALLPFPQTPSWSSRRKFHYFICITKFLYQNLRKR